MWQGVIGALTRVIKGIPPCIWVVNQHTEEITVVVSRYRPSLRFSGGGANASPTGAGLNYSTMVSIYLKLQTGYVTCLSRLSTIRRQRRSFFLKRPTPKVARPFSRSFQAWMIFVPSPFWSAETRSHTLRTTRCIWG